MKGTEEKQPAETIEDFIESAIDEAENAAVEKVEEAETAEEVEEEPEEEDGEETEDEPEESDEEDSEEETEEVEEEDKLDPPEHWAAKDKELFSSQTKEAQTWLLERHKQMEGDYTRKAQEIAAIKRRDDAIQDALKPYEHEFARAGLDHAGAVRQLASWDTALRTGGKPALLKLAQAYNIDLDEQEDQGYIDPQVSAIQNEVRSLKDLTTRQLQAAQQEKQQQIYQTIQQFEQATDDKGNPAHPHFDALKDDITMLFQLGKAKDLGDAYNRALALHPELSTPQVQPKPDRVEKVRRAKKAATGVKSSGAVAKMNREKLTLEQEIASHFE
jgi:uncharacterized protein YukE